MRFDSSYNCGCLVIKVSGERLGGPSASRLKNFVLDSYARGEHFVVLDLSDVREMDIVGVSSLLSSARAVGRDGVFAISDLSKSVLKVLELTKSSSNLLMFESSQQAVARIQMAVATDRSERIAA
jgi:anti-anti-sigma factor